MKSFKQLMESLVEAWPGTKEYTAKYGTQKSGLGSEGADGKKSGNRHNIETKDGVTRATRKYGKDGESEEQETKSDGTAPQEKRGRGRPPGKYGSYKKKVKESLDFMETLDESQLEAYLATLDEETLEELDLALSEDVEQIDELSQETLSSYGKKAEKRLDKTWNKADKLADIANDRDHPKRRDASDEWKKTRSDISKQGKNLARAAKKLVGGHMKDFKNRNESEEFDKVELDEGRKADPIGSWVVHKDGKVKEFKTRQGARSHQDKHGGEIATKDYYYSNQKKTNEDVEQSTNPIVESRGPEAIAAFISKQVKEQ